MTRLCYYYTTFQTISTFFLTVYTLYKKSRLNSINRLLKIIIYAFCKLLFNISLYSLVCSVAAGFKYGYAGDFLVPNSTSLCYRKSFLSSTSYTLPLCKFGVHFNPFWISGTLGTCLCKFGNMPRNYILLRLYLLFALLTVFTSTSYSDAMSLIFILRLI